MEKMKQIILISAALLASLLLTSCMEASISSLESILDSVPLPSIEKQRSEADFVVGEIVTTGDGVIIKGTFGEVSEKIVTTSGVAIEGVFYE